MCSARSDWPLRQPGFPIRTPPDQSLLGGSPRLIAACDVLHRLLAPRHPPYALCTLALKMLTLAMEFSRCSEFDRCHPVLAQKNAGDLVGHRQPPAARAVLAAVLSWA